MQTRSSQIQGGCSTTRGTAARALLNLKNNQRRAFFDSHSQSVLWKLAKVVISDGWFSFPEEADQAQVSRL